MLDIPETYHWGQIQCLSEDCTEVFNFALQEIQSISLPSDLSLGYYGAFEIIADQQLFLPHLSPSQHPFVNFIYQKNASQADLFEKKLLFEEELEGKAQWLWLDAQGGNFSNF